jgi:ABC-type multidrug transport system fused ATPase/permease subunit
VSIADGVIAECGTHEELLSNGGIYSKLYQTQNAGV